MNRKEGKQIVTHKLEITPSQGFLNWLQQEKISIAFTTYQTNRLILVGSKPQGSLTVNERLFDKPMGLYAQGESLYMSTRYQIWRLDNRLAPGELYQQIDRLYVPSWSYTTGNLNVHDLVIDHNNTPLFINTDFSCLATIQPGYSFTPVWQPPFITKLAAEDKCHLNGLAMVEGQPTYVTACSATDTPAGWRNHRLNGGIVIHIPSNEIIATNLSMPHSPRWYQGKLWLLNAGTGELGYLENNKFIPITFCPGFVRGLAFCGNLALVGLSKLRTRNFTGLELENRLTREGKTAQCGLIAIDITTGQIVHWLHIGSIVEELFDIVILPGVTRPKALGFQGEDIERLINFPNSGGIITTKPTVQRPRSEAVPIAGLPKPEANQPVTSQQIAHLYQKTTNEPLKYQRVYHLNPESLAPYDAMTFPSLQQRWRTKPQQGELVGVSASLAGDMVGFVIAELQADKTAQLLSLFVAPAYRCQGIGKNLIYQLQRNLQEQQCTQIQLSYIVTELTTKGLEPILTQLGWNKPQAQFFLGQTTTEVIAQAPWLNQPPLTAEFSLFPWTELTAKDRQELQLLDFPEVLSPLADKQRLELLNSLGLRYQEQLIGWIVTHRVAANTIRYSSLFVAKPFRVRGRGIYLLATAIQRQIVSPITNYKFAIASENTAMLRFLRRHLQPYLTATSESRSSVFDFHKQVGINP
ncbi:TIGR03032 family protein [Cronbergia sp. UHCC 0137]|uniref:TIGR03032 family protein n=1 Tax=Cronbergia sp. UHCC 0137 TaxID=3110239 RepID=UPI002B1EDF63|nr:TIGR03032 family protein [Cronbergia sp. UHCC 0137]MEA5621326.1 TIGR03032 family protein [Cronbergia sp. UHCC 0137]